VRGRPDTKSRPFTGSTTSMYRQVGNAVPVLYAEKLALKFIEASRNLQIYQPSFPSIQIKKPTVVSLFSGAGGMDLGFRKAGFEIIWAIDNSQDAVETYRKNLGAHIVYANIENYSLDEIPISDLVIGGFPCQGFSIANMKRSVDDSRNTLYKYFVKVVEIQKPKFFIAENVKGILSIGQGRVFEKIISDFTRCGYNCQYSILNSADYGVPQIRERVIIIGQRNDVNYTIKFPPAPTHLSSHISIGEALADFPDPVQPNNLKNHQYSKFKLKFNGFIGNRIIDPHLPSPTITARGDDRGGVVVLHHPSNQRRLTCRETAFIQGFPIDFEFIGSMTSVYRQIANAVPCPLAQAIAATIYKALTEGESVPTYSQEKMLQVKQLNLDLSV